MTNNSTPLPDAALAELDRLHAAALFQYGVRRDESAWYSLGDHTTGPHIQGDIYADRELLTRLATVWNAYPALRKRLTDAESRLAEAERERDELRGKMKVIEEIRKGLSDAVGFEPQSIETCLQVIAARDARMKREGAAEWLENKARTSKNDCMANEYRAEAARLRSEDAAKRREWGE